MSTILITLASVACVALALLGYKRLRQMRERRMSDNEYNTAVTLWNFAVLIKKHTDEMIQGRVAVLDFKDIVVPHGAGYKISLELSGHGFGIHAIPDRYDKTGRLSFYADGDLTVHAFDHAGAQAMASDPEYTGSASDVNVG